ncbi:MAG: tripartite tricarboxylate transporter permease [Kiritimatiellae bacterium]|nr:tripartite tricarboxylate transporter permease [Kiritimatiellia bacterium]
MELLSHLGDGLVLVLGWQALAAVVLGVVLGILVGAMPGLSPSMGVALLVPFTYAMAPIPALVLLIAVYMAASYGGSITAVTINAPGTPSSVVTALDGYPLTQQGRAGTALGVSLVASAVGGFVGAVVLILFSGPLAKLAVRFHPAEYFAVAVFGLTTVASLGGRNRLKAFAAAVFGLLLNTVGIDPISGVSRFTFGVAPLYDGFVLIPALIGLFALGEVFTQIGAGELEARGGGRLRAEWPALREYWRLKFGLLRASVIGTIIGVFPGAGATIAAFIAYDVAKRTSRQPEAFGQGCPEGVAAAEAANSGSVGGALVPLLTLGIPGSATTAVLIGALMIHDLVPGPLLFVDHPRIVHAIFVSLLLANVVMLALGAVGSRLWIQVTVVPRRILYPLVLTVSVVGSFAVRYSFFDVVCCAGFGFLGWLFRRHEYPVAPVVLGLVLGGIAETNFRRAVMMGGYGVFFTRPASALILAGALLCLALALARNRPK